MRLCKYSKAGCEDMFLAVNSARRATALSCCVAGRAPGQGRCGAQPAARCSIEETEVKSVDKLLV
jgi:hypothetical protein